MDVLTNAVPPAMAALNFPPEILRLAGLRPLPSRRSTPRAHALHRRTPQTQPRIYSALKPGNLMIDRNSNAVMLIDVGIARWVNKKEKGVTAVGTMGYAPPE